MQYYKDKKFLIEFGWHLAQIRKMQNLTQEELAYKCEMDITQIGRIERGTTNTSISIARKLSDGLNISIKELFDF